MQSFRTEIENPVVEKDIIDLEKKIHQFYKGEIDAERFRSLRLARGVYGQRQLGVQMIRIKLPFGKMTSEQLHRISDVSDEYSRGRLHITTRQDIQIHHVSLDRTPELWAELEKDAITLREACGNTVRNVTASETAGIDPNEPFDVSPYAQALFEFFLRNPICQEMGRKVKISFSGTDADTAISFIHDVGFIAKIKDGVHGFKVLLAGGIGSQPRHADVLYEFLEGDKIIPVTEAILRVFDRHGERAKRAKARMKFLVKQIGVDGFRTLVDEEQKALSEQLVLIDTTAYDVPVVANTMAVPSVEIKDKELFNLWKNSNVSAQKQAGLYAIGIKVHLGDFYTKNARVLADLIKKYAGNELRLSIRQNILLRHVPEASLPFFYVELSKLGYTAIGFNSIFDITSCPGTDTCNLGIASSTGISTELERVLESEYPQFVQNRDITIKISGCMNSCGQHSIANIGFQGMSIKSGKLVAPALQVLLGGGILGDGNGRFAAKVIKIPSKRGPDALRFVLNDFEKNQQTKESFLDYYDRKQEAYFYEMLKPLADTTNLQPSDFVDWGTEEAYKVAVGVGECAGVVIDLVATILFENEEKIAHAKEALELKQYADAIYYAYATIVNTAKALLISEQEKTNTQASIITQFDRLFTSKISLPTSFSDFVYQIRTNEPSQEFASKYVKDAVEFYKMATEYRAKIVQDDQ
ncbi:MAG: nitrite/sulfite reductase [Flavobacteriaceae bacterium]|nr:nitrite/sulfite reductase [Flavobacteriaceae bacterium]